MLWWKNNVCLELEEQGKSKAPFNFSWQECGNCMLLCVLLGGEGASMSNENMGRWRHALDRQADWQPSWWRSVIGNSLHINLLVLILRHGKENIWALKLLTLSGPSGQMFSLQSSKTAKVFLFKDLGFCCSEKNAGGRKSHHVLQVIAFRWTALNI